MPLTAADKKLAAAIGFDEHICEIVKQHTAGVLDRFTAFTEDDEQEDTNGLSVAVNRQDVEPVIAKLQPKLTPNGYRAFWSETFQSNGAKKSAEIAILKTADHYTIIQIRRSNGGNYGVAMEDIITRLKEWERRCQFEIFGASSDWVAIQFKTLPDNICGFAEEIYDFCPDTVEQGVGLKNERDDPETFKAARQLCPKLSKKMQKKLDEQTKRFQQMEMPPQLREMLQSHTHGFTTSTDMGIRLLAHHLQQSRQLFMWWD